MPINTCKQCKNEFQATSKRSSYCSAECVNAKERAYTRQHRSTYSPARRRAMALTQAALERGQLKPQPCEVCGEKSRRHVVAHHDDYAKPLEVRWLCGSHHKIHHYKFGPGKNAFLPAAENA